MLPVGVPLVGGGSATDSISQTLATMPPGQLLDIMSQMKVLPSFPLPLHPSFPPSLLPSFLLHRESRLREMKGAELMRDD